MNEAESEPREDGDGPVIPRLKFPYRMLSLCGILALLSCFFASYFGFGKILPKELFFSWLLTFFNAYVCAFLCRQAIGKRETGFMVWALVVNIPRFGLLIGIIALVYRLQWGNFEAFVIMTLIGYFIFMTGEIVHLHRYTMGLNHGE